MLREPHDDRLVGMMTERMKGPKRDRLVMMLCASDLDGYRLLFLSLSLSLSLTSEPTRVPQFSSPDTPPKSFILSDLRRRKSRLELMF